MSWLEETNWFDVIPKALGFIFLLLVIGMLVTWAGFVKCSQMPVLGYYWCDAYDLVFGAPRTLIVFGDSGMGDPQALQTYMRSPEILGANAVDLLPLESVSLGNLKRYKLVIVERARVMSGEQIKMFMDYVNLSQGRLIWIGDSGIERTEGELDNYSDINGLQEVSNNPWSRVIELTDEYEVISFDEFLGLRYVGNYCELVDCQDAQFSVGRLVTIPSLDHPLAYGISPELNFKITPDRDFAVVKQIANSSNSTVVVTLDFGGALTMKPGNDGEKISKTIPFVSANGVGEKVAYYAYPLEYLIEENNYYSFLKYAYKGMLGR